MSIFRSYFLKNDTLIQGNLTNNSQNPVGEISYGTPVPTVSRIIFQGDFSDLIAKIANEGIPKNSIVSHKLVMQNTIGNRHDLLGHFSYTNIIQRASSFDLDLFTLPQSWDEGSGYDFIYQDQTILNFNTVTGATNWYYRKANQKWAVSGAYIASGTTGITATTGTSKILYTQSFPKGNENVSIDITQYVNDILYSGATDNGLGLKFNSALEALTTIYKQAVAFHLRKTNTVFEPYIETTINDQITDDRKFFFLDKPNNLYLYSSAGDVTISAVTITDFNGVIISTLTGSSITRVKKGVYMITLTVDSSAYPDAVLFKDSWILTQNSKLKTIHQEFYLIDQDRYYNFDLTNVINPDNFYFTYYGIKSGEYIKRGDVRKIQILVKQLYHTQDDNLPMNLSYRLYMHQGSHTHMDIIPYTQVNRTSAGYEFYLDTSWLIPQDYYLDLKFSSNSFVTVKSPISFTIVNDDAFSA